MNQAFITPQKIIEELSISEATIRNWIKSGDLVRLSSGKISLESYIHLKNTAIGAGKLSKRANKLHSGTKAGISTAQDAYEASLSAAHKNAEGIFYTPPSITAELLSLAGEINNQTTFCDPCCGTGNFLIAALDAGVAPENIYGFDTDAAAIEIARQRLFEKTGSKTANLEVRDFLEERRTPHTQERCYDLIITNPPWGKKLNAAQKQRFADIHNNGEKTDSSALFAMACLKALKKGGTLGLLLPEAFFNVAAYTGVRAKLLQHDISHLLDYGKAFEGLQTRAQAMILRNNPPSPRSAINCRYAGKQFSRTQSEFGDNPACIYNFHADAQDAATIRHLYHQPHTTLQGRAQWALGIVTGNNGRFISPEQQDGTIPVYKGSDIEKNGFKAPTHFMPDDFSLYQQVAPLDLYRAPEKLAYRFICSRLVFAYDDQQRYFLNSANMLIPDERAIGITNRQLAFLLNTDLYSWMFERIFRTHKILRADLEKLPIFTEFFQNCGKEYTEQALHAYLGIEQDGKSFKTIKPRS